MVELADEPGIEKEFAELRASQTRTVYCGRLPLDAKAAERALELAKTDVDTHSFLRQR